MTALCSSKLDGKFPVLVRLQVSLSSLCAPGWAERHNTISTATAFCVRGVLGIFTDHKGHRAHPSQKLGPAAAHPPSKERRKGSVFPGTLQFKDLAQKFTCNECPGFQLMHAHVLHVCHPPRVFDPLPAAISWKGVESLIKHWGTASVLLKPSVMLSHMCFATFSAHTRSV